LITPGICRNVRPGAKPNRRSTGPILWNARFTATTAAGEHQVLQFPEEVGCFALREKGGFIVALRSGIWLTDAHGLLQRKVCDNPSNPQLARFNDGGTDRDGRFYAGTFWGPGDYNGALLMRIDNDLTRR
jgi:sugar lactone lactonase YvrE